MIPLKVAFYTEAGTNRGMGHLIRCHSIYEEFKISIEEIDFYLDSDINFDYKFDNIIYFNWKTLEIKRNHYDIVFIDSYLADIGIYNSFTKFSKLVIFIDDYGRLSYPKGVIINFAPDADKLFFNEKKENTIYLLGEKYVPLRKIFLKQKINKKKQLIVMLGGNTKDDIFIDIINSIKQIDIEKVIVTSSSTLIKKLKNYSKIRILNKVKDEELIKEMSNSSLAISTASMSVYELAYFNIPNLIITISSNQEIGASQLIKHKLANIYISMQKDTWKDTLSKEIVSLLTFKNYKNNIIDGKGSYNIKKEVLGLIK